MASPKEEKEAENLWMQKFGVKTKREEKWARKQLAKSTWGGKK